MNEKQYLVYQFWTELLPFILTQMRQETLSVVQPSQSGVFFNESQPHYHLKVAGFTEGNDAADKCNVYDYPLYDPYFFKDYCSTMYWCLTLYSDTCEPSNAFGLNGWQVRVATAGIVVVPWYLMMFMVNLFVFPAILCLWVADEYFMDSLGVCTLGLVGGGSAWSVGSFSAM